MNDDEDDGCVSVFFIVTFVFLSMLTVVGAVWATVAMISHVVDLFAAKTYGAAAGFICGTVFVDLAFGLVLFAFVVSIDSVGLVAVKHV